MDRPKTRSRPPDGPPDPPPRRVLFVCTGNSCRSPMAEALFRARLAGRGGWEAASAGTRTVAGLPPSRMAVLALQELGIPLAEHRTRPLDPGLIRAAAWILPMTREHRAELLAAHPGAASRIRLLSEFESVPGPADVPDPFGEDLFSYRRIRDRLDRAVGDLIVRLIAPPRGGATEN